MTHHTTVLAPDASFLDAAARHILAFVADEAAPTQLLKSSIVIPNLKITAPLAVALGSAAGSSTLLPRIDTLSGMAEPWMCEVDHTPDSRRELILHAVLRSRRWFEEAELWDVAGELIAFFDVLTDHAVRLPDGEAELLSRLERAFGLYNAAPLAFEARLVHTLWQAEAQGRPSRRVARLLALRQWIGNLKGPLVVFSESEDDPVLDEVIAAAARRVRVLQFVPDRSWCEGATARVLQAAWPCHAKNPDAAQYGPLLARAAALGREDAGAARNDLALWEAASLEELAAFVRDQVLAWIGEGRQRIALVAADRLVARRARALLEREAVLVDDETGWKLSTTRAAATVDAWLEVLATDGYHRAVTDLLRSPFLFGDLEAAFRAQSLAEAEALVARSGIISGLDRLREAAGADGPAAAVLLHRLLQMRSVMAAQQRASIAEWLRRLRRALEGLGGIARLASDAAGSAWLDWLELRIDELAQDGELFVFAHWRRWFDREMDAAMFRDGSIDSPIVMTHLAATRLRAFDASIVIGADCEHLAPPRLPAWLTHGGVRRELGLPGQEVERQRLPEDLAALILSSGKTVICWQGQRREEILLPAPQVDVLAQVLGVAGGTSPVTRVKVAEVPAAAQPGPTRRSAPAVPIDRVPTRISASGLQTLFDCPYRYFARHVLGLRESEELVEGLEKRDFGTTVHAILHAFHAAWPDLSAHSDQTLIEALAAISEQAFAPWVERNFLDHAWRVRWLGRLASYVTWQRRREGEGWRVAVQEEVSIRRLHLGDDRQIELQGRIDRRDVRGREHSLLDYKSRGLSALRRQVADPDDAQLAFYALLSEVPPVEAAYVALDDDRLDAVKVDDVEGVAARVLERLQGAFAAMRDGAGMPAHGVDRICAHCEMRGLCREEWLR